MALAVLLYIIARWARNEPAVTLQGVLAGLFVIFVVGLLDRGRTEEVARGIAWLFFIVAAYNAIPAYTGAIGSAHGGISPSTGPSSVPPTIV